MSPLRSFHAAWLALAAAACDTGPDRVPIPVPVCQNSDCSSPTPPSAAAGSAGSTGPAGNGGSGGTGGAPTPVDPCEGVDLAAPLPAEVPEGWVRWNGFSCNVPYYVPSAPEHLPPPIAWEPCPGKEACQFMTVDWAEHGGVPAMAFGPWLDTTDPADPKLQFFRVEFNIPIDDDAYEMAVRTAIVASVDGPVHHAIVGHHRYLKNNDVTQPYFQPLMSSQGKSGVAVEVYKNLPHEGNFGLLLWDLESESLAPTVISQSDTRYTYRIGGEWIVRQSANFGGPAEVLRPDGSDVQQLTPYNERSAVVVGDRVIFSADTPEGKGLHLWSEEHGTETLLNFPYGEGKAIWELEADAEYVTYQVEDTSTSPATVEIFASPFPHEALGFQPHRVRAALWQPGDKRVKLGCGYLGRDLTDPAIIRADDGHTWRLLHTDRITFADVLGFTCQEVFTFAQVWNAAHTAWFATIMRIRLDSLGPGEPADP